MMSTLNGLIWQTQNALHKQPQAVPGILLLLASSLVVHQHMTHSADGHASDHIKTFLAFTAAQMLPLVALEMKIMSCADPVGLFCKSAMPVTVIHIFFLGVRLVMHSQYDRDCLVYSGIFFVGGLLAIRNGYRQNWLKIVQLPAVWFLISLALAASIAVTSLDAYLNTMTWKTFFEMAIVTWGEYAELVAFAPAVWFVYREDQCAGRAQLTSADTKRISTTFFFLIVGFYAAEDLGDAYFLYHLSWKASLAHVAHFCLLADFALYILIHIYNPEKLVGQLCRWLPSDFYHEV